jgi:hypothetical protein
MPLLGAIDADQNEIHQSFSANPPVSDFIQIHRVVLEMKHADVER